MSRSTRPSSPVASYILGKRIAKGGMAEIFLGKTPSNFVVAVKRILPHHSSDAEFLEMFRHEAMVCKYLNHPHIARVYDFVKS